MPVPHHTKHREEATDDEGIKYVTREEGQSIIDRQARKYLGMSGAEFVHKYEAGEIADPDRSEVVRVAMLIPFSK